MTIKNEKGEVLLNYQDRVSYLYGYVSDLVRIDVICYNKLLLHATLLNRRFIVKTNFSEKLFLISYCSNNDLFDIKNIIVFNYSFVNSIIDYNKYIIL